ncbi:MAG: acetylxylan esterase [candidate division KSB1 bacterium]|nr:acetylxylan esterase [candidate division KSB1 bacterium]MDZ7317673.1 acetylxylan esterase [candidate division KSB1 bacterium]MDZ7341533.1 acetylxylan esterase [candidate division KSB1 bacterium]
MPLLFDMPLEQLKTYQGCNPKPADFDRFWDDGIAEVREIDPEVEFIAADFQTPIADCRDLYFTSVGGARIHAKLLQPRSSVKPQPALLMFHGYAGNAGDWCDKLNYIALGYTVAAMDCRGQGGSSEDMGSVRGNTLKGHIIRGLEDAPEKLLYRQIFLDTVQLARVVMNLPGVDPNRIGAMGASQGGGLTLACAGLEPRIKRAAPVFPFLCDYQRVWQIDLAEQAYEELRDFFRRFDPRHQREQEIFTRLGYIDVQHLCPRIRGEVFMGVGLMDTICPPSTQFAAYNKITAKKSLAIYPDYGHEFLPGHADHVFQFMAQL